jgi:hypothetical protein
MPVSKNTWNKGLKSDFSKLKSQQDSYLDAKNIRIITDEGTSTFAVENIRGTKFSFKIPKVNVTYEIDFTGITGNVDVTIARSSGSDIITLTNVENKSNQSLANELNVGIQASSVLYSQYIIAYYNNNYLVVYDFLPQSLLSSGELILTTNPSCSAIKTNSVEYHTILGYGSYNNNIVLITCNKDSESENPSNQEGFIWNAEYNNTLNVITNIDGDYLNPLYHLKYAGKLNLSREYAINKHLKCRYENDSVVRVVWTDGYNNLKTANIADPQIYSVPEELLSYLPQHYFQKPIVTRLITGGTIPVCKIQYFYQLYSNQGASSSFSPVSNLLVLSTADPNDYSEGGATLGTNSAKSVEITISDIDTNYDIIRIGYVIYQTLDFPQSFFFDENVIPPSGTYVVIHNGNENDIFVNTINVSNLNRPPEVFKTIEVVRNRLFAANAKTTYFDIPVEEFDARAYRFTSASAPQDRVSELYNSTDTYGTPSVIIDAVANTINIDGTVSTPIDYTLIPDSFDCYNSFNNENPDPSVNPYSNGDWANFSQFKYQSNGTVLGGTGANISYEFVTFNSLAADPTFRTQSPYISPQFDSNAFYSNIDTYIYPGGNNLTLDTHKSPIYETLFTGYARGEVYRFGIVFYDIYGYPSYVNWIGDIKFPFASDIGLTQLDTSYANHSVILQQIGIKFSLNTSTSQFQSIRNKISGWSYVRVKRESFDKSRLGTGLIQATIVSDDYSFYGLVPFVNNNPSFFSYGLSGDGSDIDYTYYRANVQVFYSPNFLTRQSLPTYQSGDYIRMIGRTYNYGAGNRPQYSVRLNNSAYPEWPDPADWYGYYITAKDMDYNYTDVPFLTGANVGEVTSANSKHNLNNFVYVNYSTNGDFIAGSTINSTGTNLDFYNMASRDWSNFSDKYFGNWGAECIVLGFKETAPFATQAPDLSTLFVNHWGPQSLNSTNDSMYLGFYMASYERYLINQYGGWKRSDRYGNQYILTNSFVPYNNDLTGTVFTIVYGGDTWVTYFDWQRDNKNINEDSGWDPDILPNVDKFATAYFFPAECNFNSELNVITQHASVRNQDVSGTAPIKASNYVYNTAYNQENNTVVHLSKQLNQSLVNKQPHTIYGSESKLDNERLDSWRVFLTDNALSVNGNYGEINRLIQFKDKLFYYQNDAVGIAAVDERILTNEGESTQTQLGTGTLLQRFDYITTQTGSLHSFAVEATDTAIYHYDASINKMFKYSIGKTKDDISGMTPLTDIRGLSGFFRTAFVDTDLKSKDKTLITDRVGIVSGYNSEYSTVYFTIFDEGKNVQHTFSYNEILDSFESFYDFYPSLYLNMRKRFVSVNPIEVINDNYHSEVYIHNIGIRNHIYKSYYDSEIKFRVNENADFVKTFDNIQINTEVILNNLQLAETITKYAISNDYQIVNERFSNFVQKIRTWRVQVPRDESNPVLTIKPRISDKYMDVTFKFDTNNLDKTFRLHDVLTEYSMRSKILPR